MGPHQRKSLGSYAFSLLERQERGVNPILYVDEPACIQTLAFSTLAPTITSQSRPPCLPEPISSDSASNSKEPFFWTWADLEGVVEVTLCRANGGINGGYITGLIFRYSNGHQASVGQVRRDRLNQPRQVDGSAGMWLTFPRRRCCISSVDFSPQAPINGQSYFEMPWRGRLEWWYSYRQCRVYHEEKSSRPVDSHH